MPFTEGDLYCYWESWNKDASFSKKAVLLAVVGMPRVGKTTVLRRFLSMVRNPLRLGTTITKKENGNHVYYADYYDFQSFLSSSSSLLFADTLVLDHIARFSAFLTLNSRSFNALPLNRLAGCLIVSCEAISDIPEVLSSGRLLVPFQLSSCRLDIAMKLRLLNPEPHSLRACDLCKEMPRGITQGEAVGCAIDALLLMRSNIFEYDTFEKALRKQFVRQDKDQIIRKLPFSLRAIYDRLVLLSRIHLIKELDISMGPVAARTRATSGILLYGESGSGKTLLARLICQHFSTIPSFFVLSHSIFGMYLGETEERLRAIFREARRCSPCIVVFEDIDVLAQRRSADGEGASVIKRVLTTLLCELDGFEENSDVLVIGTTSALHTIDSALLRQGRLETVIEMPLLSKEDIRDIFSDLSVSQERIVELESLLLNKPLSDADQILRGMLL